MAFHKITRMFNPDDTATQYYGCKWEQREDGIYADVPEYAVEDYIKCGRIFPNKEEKKDEKPEVKDVAPENKSAEDVVSGKTVDAVEKKEARVEKAKTAKTKSKGK